MNYLRKPFKIVDGIPIFSEEDNYIRNYQKISNDHIRSLQDHKRSPFMVTEHIVELDKQTCEVVRRQLPHGSRLLDAGIGLGGLVAGLREYECHGADISLPYLRKAKHVCATVIMAKLEELPYIDRSFDAVLCCDVLEHLFALDRACEQMIRLIKPGGKLIVRVPNNEPLESYINEPIYKHSHVRAFSAESLRLYFEKCFSLQFVEELFVCYEFLHFRQIKCSLWPIQADLKRKLDTVLSSNSGSVGSKYFENLRSIASVSFEQLGDDLLAIKQMYPGIFNSLKTDIIHPLGLIAVFQKP